MTDLEELKTERNLRDYAERNLQKSGKMFCCPACGSGTHGGRNSDGALSINGDLWKCFACGAGGSVIDLIMVTEGKDTAAAVTRLRELYDPNYNPYSPPSQRTAAAASKPMPTTKVNPVPATKINPEGGRAMNDKKEQQEIRRDFRNYYKRCRKRLYETDYLQRRGLDEETAKLFGLGYEPNWISPTAAYNRKQENAEREKAGQAPLPPLTPSPRLIIPLSKNNYLARDTRPDEQLTDSQKKYKKMNEGQGKPFFNRKAIENPLCFFITEGELDAISIEQAGGSCVALGSTVKAKAFGEMLRQLDAMETGTVIIALDNDPAGQKAAEQIADACEIAGIDYIKVNAAGQYKDPNDFLVHDRQGFYDTIRKIVKEVRAERLADYESLNAGHAAADFMRRPDTAGAAIPTGFTKLDEFLDGGLPSGLVFIGGLSSLGKTTLALQIAENIATNKYPAGTQDVIRGRDVLYFALEQSKNDLLSKILSRRTFLASREAKQKEALAKTNIQLIHREKWGSWLPDEWNTLWKCYKEFQRDVGDNLYLIESPGDITALDIVKITEKHIAFTGRVPVVVVDYLQILKSIDPKMTDKQAVDRTIVTLARLAKMQETTVIGISSFNRENYWQKASMTAFKDSGNLEYSAEILFAIAPAEIKEAAGETDKTENKEAVEKCREAKEKHLQLHVLKNKSGKVTGKTRQLFFNYHSWFNYFEEEEKSYLSYFDNGNPAATGKNIVKKI